MHGSGSGPQKGETMSNDELKILEKVKKLLRLADESRGATPAEAATAAAIPLRSGVEAGAKDRRRLT